MIGQGLIQQTRRATTDEIARGYLDELISRNMVQVKDLTLDSRVRSCYLHDLLRNICLVKAEEEIGLENLMGDRHITLQKPRHRVVECDDIGSLSMNQNKHIRSLYLLYWDESLREIKSSYWKSFQHLKTLNLDGCLYLQTLPHSFRLLLGLRQLRIHTILDTTLPEDFTPGFFSMPLKLPTWLNNLKKLEQLDMGTMTIELPNVGLEMHSLRHIHANCILGPMIGESLKNVETLKYIRHEDWMRSSLRLMDGCDIRELGIVVEGESSKLGESLEKLKNLVKLHLLWRRYDHSVDLAIIPSLGNLTKLKLRGDMRKWPSLSMLPPNLSHLTLEWSYLREDAMEELTKLPKLSYLKLKGNSYLGERIQVLHDGFPSLRGMSLRGLYSLRSIDVEEGGMPQLELLQVDCCYFLDTESLSNKSYQLQNLTNIRR